MPPKPEQYGHHGRAAARFATTNLGALLRRAAVTKAFAAPKQRHVRINYTILGDALRAFALEHYRNNPLAIPDRPLGKPNKGDTR
jgi:hypothetical protein